MSTKWQHLLVVNVFESPKQTKVLWKHLGQFLRSRGRLCRLNAYLPNTLRKVNTRNEKLAVSRTSFVLIFASASESFFRFPWAVNEKFLQVLFMKSSYKLSKLKNHNRSNCWKLLKCLIFFVKNASSQISKELDIHIDDRISIWGWKKSLASGFHERSKLDLFPLQVQQINHKSCDVKICKFLD